MKSDEYGNFIKSGYYKGTFGIDTVHAPKHEIEKKKPQVLGGGY
jgi:hypothetical protein